jgi:hypothetical protein
MPGWRASIYEAAKRPYGYPVSKENFKANLANEFRKWKLMGQMVKKNQKTRGDADIPNFARIPRRPPSKTATGYWARRALQARMNLAGHNELLETDPNLKRRRKYKEGEWQKAIKAVNVKELPDSIENPFYEEDMAKFNAPTSSRTIPPKTETYRRHKGLA